MKKFILTASLIILTLPIASLAQTSIPPVPTSSTGIPTPPVPGNTSCELPVNPATVADLIPTITCLENSISTLESRISVLESRIAGYSNSGGQTTPIPPQIVQQGVTSPSVKAVQTFLKAQGSFTGPQATGYFGSVTKNAVLNFQAEQGLTQTGVIDQQTLNKIQTLAPQIASSVVPMLQQIQAPPPQTQTQQNIP